MTEQPRALESIAIHPLAKHGVMVVASYDRHTTTEAWRVATPRDLGDVVGAILSGVDPGAIAERVGVDESSRATESQQVFALRMGVQLDMLVNDFVLAQSGGTTPADATPLLRSSASIAVATMLLQRAAHLTPRQTLDQIIDVLSSGDVLQGDRAARRRAARRLILPGGSG